MLLLHSHLRGSGLLPIIGATVFRGNLEFQILLAAQTCQEAQGRKRMSLYGQYGRVYGEMFSSFAGGLFLVGFRITSGHQGLYRFTLGLGLVSFTLGVLPKRDGRQPEQWKNS